METSIIIALLAMLVVGMFSSVTQPRSRPQIIVMQAEEPSSVGAGCITPILFGLLLIGLITFLGQG